MTNPIHILSRAVMALMACVLVALPGCSSGDEPAMSQPDGPLYRAGLYVTVDGGDARSSRAPSPGEYDPGSLAENYIDIPNGDFQIYVFDMSDIYLGLLQDIEIKSVSSLGNSKTYEITGALTETVFKTINYRPVRVMMVANWRGTYPTLQPGVSKIADVAAASDFVFEYGKDEFVSAEHPIPMFGVTDRLDIQFDEYETTDLGTLHLLRAYSKIVVRRHPQGKAIKSVKLTRANNKGKRAPVGVRRQGDYVHGNYSLDYWRKTSVPDDASPVTDIPLIPTADGDWVIYVPEYRNLTGAEGSTPRPSAERSRLAVVFEDEINEDGKDNVEYVDFKYYQAPPAYVTGAERGDHFDLLRNTAYAFTLYKTKDLSVAVDIQPYAEVHVYPTFGLDRDNDGYLITKRYEDGSYDVLIGDKFVQRDPDGDEIIKRFRDGSLLCHLTILKDYIHDTSEINYTAYIEKDKPGGNMVIIREQSAGGDYTNDEDLLNDLKDHTHDLTDRPLFVLDGNGAYLYVTYDEDGKPTTSPYDMNGDTIIQANGFQYRRTITSDPYMYSLIGTYLVRLYNEDGTTTEVLRWYKDGKDLPWDPDNGLATPPLLQRAFIATKRR